MLEFETSKSNSEVLKSNSKILVRNIFFLESDVTSEGAVSHNVLYYQRLSTPLIAKKQVSFYANNYFEQLPIVSSGFNFWSIYQSITQRFMCLQALWADSLVKFSPVRT